MDVWKTKPVVPHIVMFVNVASLYVSECMKECVYKGSLIECVCILECSFIEGVYVCEGSVIESVFVFVELDS